MAEKVMKIIDVEKDQVEFIDIDDEEYPSYRRFSGGVWEVSMGESWEPVYFSKDLEAAYQEYIAVRDE